MPSEGELESSMEALSSGEHLALAPGLPPRRPSTLSTASFLVLVTPGVGYYAGSRGGVIRPRPIRSATLADHIDWALQREVRPAPGGGGLTGP